MQILEEVGAASVRLEIRAHPDTVRPIRLGMGPQQDPDGGRVERPPRSLSGWAGQSESTWSEARALQSLPWGRGRRLT